MRGYMFRNRWFALLFVCLTLAGVTKLIGTEEDGGTIQEATDQLTQVKDQAEQMTTQTTPAGDDTTFDAPLASDEELIDQALGEDPTPVDEFAATQPAEEETPADEVIIVSQGPAAPNPVEVPLQ